MKKDFCLVKGKSLFTKEKWYLPSTDTRWERPGSSNPKLNWQRWWRPSLLSKVSEWKELPPPPRNVPHTVWLLVNAVYYTVNYSLNSTTKMQFLLLMMNFWWRESWWWWTVALINHQINQQCEYRCACLRCCPVWLYSVVLSCETFVLIGWAVGCGWLLGALPVP